MKKRWQLIQSDENNIADLAAALSVSLVMARILVNRGIHTIEEGDRFLNGTIADMHDPFQMKDMTKAVHRLAQAVEKGEQIVIYGDYDVDGITSTSLMCRVLRDLGASPSYYIPERLSEGYGLNGEALDKLVRRGTTVLITVDCGISSYEDIARLQDQLDIIITDHHEPPHRLPPAIAVLNPKQKDCSYPCKNLAGVGVAYALCRALWQHLKGIPLTDYMELAALGTVADLVPLTGENRFIVKAGLQCMKNGKNLGLQELLRVSGLVGKELTAGRIAFTIAPRLNAAGRISYAAQGVRLLLESDAAAAQDIAVELDEMNSQRQEMERDIARQAIEQLETSGRSDKGVLIAYGQDWHPGVIGIAASRLVERFYRPALVIGLTDGIGRGSCRSISGFNMYEALCTADDLLIKYGGHPMAAGFSIREENIEALWQRLNTYADSHMTKDDYIPRISVDMPLSSQDVTLELIDELAFLEPYGIGNPRPVFTLENQTITESRPIGKTKEHLRVVVENEKGEKLSGVGWSMADYNDMVSDGDKADLAFTLEKNEFNGACTPQMVLQDIHAAELPIRLNRPVMVMVYTQLKQLLSGPQLSVRLIKQQLAAQLARTINKRTVYMAVQVLLEIGVLQEYKEAAEPVYVLPAIKGKMSLDTSPSYIKYGGE